MDAISLAPSRRTIAWGIGDQGVSSAINFAAAVLAARALDPAGFGAVAIGFSAYLLAMGISRAWGGDPMTVRFSARPSSERAEALGDAAGSSLAVGCGFGVVLVATGALVGSDTGSVLLVVGLMLPMVLVQDLVRVALVMEGRPRSAFANDSIWLVTVLISFGALSGEALEPAGAIGAWLIGGLLAGAIGLVQTGARPSINVVVWWRNHRDLGVRYSLEFLIAAGTGSVITIGVAILGSTADSAGLRGAQVVLGPLNIAIIGGSMLALPHMARVGARRRTDLRRPAQRFSAALFITVVLWGGILMALPDVIGESLLGQSWAATASLLPLALWGYLAQTAVSGPTSALRALGAASESLRMRLVLTPVLLGVGIVGAMFAGPAGATGGLAAVNTLAVPAWWWMMRRVIAVAPKDDS
jgi:O-antigen/teichoic acid export membrane protein